MKAVYEPLSSSEGGVQWKSKTGGGKNSPSKPIWVRRTVYSRFFFFENLIYYILFFSS
jgi:hypothetical protein